MLVHGRLIQPVIYAQWVGGLGEYNFILNRIFFAGDDSQALVWDLNQMRKSVKDPILCYSSQQEINQIHWNKHLTDWVAIASGSVVEALHI